MVAGNRLHGTVPEGYVGGSRDVGNGRLLPSTGVVQLAASLASWFGVGSSDLRTVLPYSGNLDLN